MTDDMRELSRLKWTTKTMSLEDINTGSLLRIADAVEKMTVRHTELMRDRDMYERWYTAKCGMVRRLERQLAAAKGQITKLKNARAARAKDKP